MSQVVSAKDLTGKTFNINLLQTPDKCPRCHNKIHATIIYSYVGKEQKICQSIFLCPNQTCQELFIGSYNLAQQSDIQGRYPGVLANIAPWKAVKGNFPLTIERISPNFVEIYDQALVAESHNLFQLVGIGLRKSLEFLIKDFAVSEYPDKEIEIRGTLLGSCINEYVIDASVKECAKRATWLGNDETHYVRKWEDKDINDLKLLVKLTVNWIDNVLLTKQYIAEMPAKQT